MQEVYLEYGTPRRFQYFVTKGSFSMLKIERKELVTQMRVVKILFTRINGGKSMTIGLPVS